MFGYTLEQVLAAKPNPSLGSANESGGQSAASGTAETPWQDGFRIIRGALRGANRAKPYNA